MSGLPEVVPSPSQCPQDGVDLLQPTSQHDISDHIDPNGHVRTDQDSPDQHDSTDETSDIMAFQTNGSADSGCSLHCEGKTGVELDKHDQDEAALVGGHFPLSSLPTDTLLHVFSFLRKNEQLRMSAVCKPWRQLIFSSACLWRKRQLTLRCSRHSRHSRNAFFYARRLGHYLHKLTVACEHPSNHSCRSMAICFRKLMTGLKAPASLRSFKVNDLRLRYTRASVLLDISDSPRALHPLPTAPQVLPDVQRSMVGTGGGSGDHQCLDGLSGYPPHSEDRRVSSCQGLFQPGLRMFSLRALEASGVLASSPSIIFT